MFINILCVSLSPFDKNMNCIDNPMINFSFKLIFSLLQCYVNLTIVQRKTLFSFIRVVDRQSTGLQGINLIFERVS